MNRVFLATNGSRLARAENNASGSWEVEFLLEGTPITCLAMDPCNPNVAYAGTRGNGILRTDNRGKTWQNAGMQNQVVKAIAVSPAKPGLVFAGTKPPAVFVSHDGAQTWIELPAFRKMRRWFWFTPAERGDPYIQGIALSATDPDVIVAGVECGAVLRSTDGGKTWTGHLAGAVRDCHSLVFHSTDGFMKVVERALRSAVTAGQRGNNPIRCRSCIMSGSSAIGAQILPVQDWIDVMAGQLRLIPPAQTSGMSQQRPDRLKLMLRAKLRPSFIENRVIPLGKG
jgi:hypothetical protein